MWRKQWIKRFACIAGWIIVAVSVPWGLWWLHCIPTPGKGGLLLALVATVMPLVWDDVHAFGRAGLILALVILFAVEYRAIDKDRKDYAKEQRKAREEERDSFKTLLEEERNGVKGILDHEQKNFQEMFDSFDKAQQKETREFGALLKKEDDLFTHEQQLSEALTGKLVPASDPMPENQCSPLEKDQVMMFLGDKSAHAVTTFPHTILRIAGKDVVSIDRSLTGALTILLEIRGEDSRIIARLNKGGFVINRNNELQITRPDKSSLIIEDQYGVEVLNVRYLNRQAFRLTAFLHYLGKPVQVPYPGLTIGCSSHTSTDIELGPHF